MISSGDKFRIEMNQLARAQKIPLTVDFELTARCNLNCKMCYVHVLDSHAAMLKELTTEQWTNIFDDAVDSGMMFCLLTGGECLARKDFFELYLHLYQKGIRISINTNGALITDKHIDIFRRYPPNYIQISLYGSSNSSYEELTGYPVFEKVANNIERLIDAGVNVKIAVTPSKYMFDDFRNILEYIKSHNLKYEKRGEILLMDARDDVASIDYNLSVDELIELQKIRLDVFGLKRRPMENPPKPGGNYCGEPIEGSPCNAATAKASISWDGMLKPCIGFDMIKIPVLSVGFKEAWKQASAKMQELFKQPVECIECPYLKYCTRCPIFKCEDFTSGHCKKSVCEYMERQAREGIIYFRQKAKNDDLVSP